MNLQPFKGSALLRTTLFALFAGLAQAGETGTTNLESLTQAGLPLGEGAVVSDCSADGRYVVFRTQAALVPEDLNGVEDVYVRDRQNGAVVCASRNYQGGFGSSSSRNGRISDDGRYVLFISGSSDLIPFDTNNVWDVFRKDLQTGELLRVSQAIGSIVASNGTSHHPQMSADGRYVVFVSDSTDLVAGVSNSVLDVYWRDMLVPNMVRVTTGILSEPNGDSYNPFVSDDGLRVVYSSFSSNLVLGDTNGAGDVFVQDLGGGLPQIVSVAPDGSGGNAQSAAEGISSDGTRVVFTSLASNLVDNDFNGSFDIFWTDLAVGEINLVSVATDGLSGDQGSGVARLSADGRFVLFDSTATNLLDTPVNLTSVYLFEIATGATSLVSRPTGANAWPDDISGIGALSADGSVAVFSSLATNLVPGDVNAVVDVFSRELIADPAAHCAPSTSSAGCQASISSTGAPSASGLGSFMVSATDVPNDKPGILFYGFGASSSAPFLGGFLCMTPPVYRAPILFSGGNPGSIEDCSGSFSIDMNAFAAGALGGTPRPELSQMGQMVQAQFWGRDPSDSVHGSFLSDALEYVVGP